MKSTIFALAAFAALALPAAAAPYSNLKFREIGPAAATGRVTSVAGSAHNDKLYYAGAAGGGVWKSVDGGHTWSNVFDGQNISAIGAIAVDPQNDDVVYVGTGEANPRNDVSYGNGVYKTTDGGKTWTNIGLKGTRHIARILVDPKDSRHIIVGALGDVFADSTERGVYVSFDGGATWAKTLYLSPISGASDLAMDAGRPNVVFAGMWHFRRKSWTFESGGEDDGIFKSTDGGRTWQRLAGHGLPEGNTGRVGLAVAPSDGSRVYALIESREGTLWRSDDGGSTWMLDTKNTLVNQRPFYFSHLEVDPHNKNRVYSISAQMAMSEDGGKQFHVIGDDLHWDFHTMWIDPSDSDRMILGGDGGQFISNDGGEHWFSSKNLPIGQIYHVGYSVNEDPYTLCIGLQDNNAWCGPSNSLDQGGIQNKYWSTVVGGDGEWSVPDPLNPHIIWSDSQNAGVQVLNRDTADSWWSQPYLATAGQFFDSSTSPYRFNWSSPIAFAPWDGKIAWVGGNVVFQSGDQGKTWKPISPDLTRNVKEHQRPSGGPITNDVSGAESSDNILDIEGSPLHRGEIWAGTDDGLIQLTLDGGKHWKNVTPSDIPEFGHVETVAPSPLKDGTAYASIDNHMAGDYKPYLIVTHDFGRTWSRIVSGLPDDQYARTVRPDIRNPNLVFAGTENGLWISFDGGAQWQDFRNNLPAVAVRDIRIQPQADDLIVATHGRGLYILDDLRPVQELTAAVAAGTQLFAPRTAVQYTMRITDEGHNTEYSAANPRYGVLLTYYQKTAAATAPKLEILDSYGHAIRTIQGTHDAGGKQVPYLPNKDGMNRYAWDFNEDPPQAWNGAANKEYGAPPVGAYVVPGHYTARLTLGGKVLMQGFNVKPDPRSKLTQADYVEGYRFAKHIVREIDTMDRMLNALDDAKKSLDSIKAADTSLQSQVDALAKQRDALSSELSANFENGEDLIMRPGKVREDVGAWYGYEAPLTQNIRDYQRMADAELSAATEQYNAFCASVHSLNTTLQRAGLKLLPEMSPIK